MSTTPTLTSGTVMDGAAATQNDAAKSIFTYAVQVPYLNMALQDLQEIFELNNVPVTDTVSGVIASIPVGTTALAFGGNSPKLPDDLIEPSILWERLHAVDPYTMMTRVDFLPESLSGVQLNQFIWYTWQSNEIRFLAANQVNDIKMDYTRNLFARVPSNSTGTEALNIINGVGYLTYRTGALLAEYIGENPTRAQQLNSDAILALDRIVGIGSKGRQKIMTRHRPFRNGFKRRSYM